MGFEVQQVRKLRAKLKPRNIRTRQSDGATLSYIEGWHVIAEANRIFGFDGWDRETVETTCVWTKQNGSRFSAAYVTRIRVTVKAGGSTIIREGSGAGEAHSASPGQAHEMAAKGAETDATKRAMMTFGNAFGLSLYGGSGYEPPSRKASTVKAEDGPQTQSKKSSMPATPINSTAEGPAGQEPITATITPAHETAPEWATFDPLEEAARRAVAKGRIDKSALPLSEPRRLRDRNHLRHVASRPCLICGRNRTQAHHIKFLQPNAMGRKVSDEFTVPLCSTHHGELHASGNELHWWQGKGIDPEPVAMGLWQDSITRQEPNVVQPLMMRGKN
jgi:DNA recombination protein Rad52